MYVCLVARSTMQKETVDKGIEALVEGQKGLGFVVSEETV